MDSYHRANELFVDEEYDAAAALYSKAVAEMPDFASALSCRSAAYIKLRKYTQALEDCNNVIKLDASLEPAYLRKGLACFELGEYETAKRAFETGKRLRSEAGKDVTVYARNIRKCDTELSHPNGVFQAAPVPPAAPAAAPIAPAPAPAPSSAAPSSSSSTAMTTPIPHAIKYQYYQSAEAVNISVLAKNVTPDEAEISIQPGHLRVRCRGETVIDKQLYADVDVGASTYDIRKTKIEIVLRKVRTSRPPGKRAVPPGRARPFTSLAYTVCRTQVEKEIWPALEGDGPARTAPPPPAAAAAATPAPAPAADKPAMPKPYASKRDWNAVEQVRSSLDPI